MKVRIAAFAVALAVALSMAPSAFSSSQRIDGVFRDANRAYFEGDTRKAVELYGILLEAGVRDPDVHYNLGVSFARLGEYGRAILHFERAIALRPGDKGALEGAEAARAALIERDATQASDIVDSRSDVSALVRSISEPTLAVIVLLANLLFFACLVLRRFVRRESLRIALVASASLAFLGLGIGFAGLAVKRDFFGEGRAGIVTGRDVAILEGPHSLAGSRGRAREGERARLFETDEGYVRVRLDGGRQGWIARSAVEAI